MNDIVKGQLNKKYIKIITAENRFKTVIFFLISNLCFLIGFYFIVYYLFNPYGYKSPAGILIFIFTPFMVALVTFPIGLNTIKIYSNGIEFFNMSIRKRNFIPYNEIQSVTYYRISPRKWYMTETSLFQLTLADEYRDKYKPRIIPKYRPIIDLPNMSTLGLTDTEIMKIEGIFLENNIELHDSHEYITFQEYIKLRDS